MDVSLALGLGAAAGLALGAAAALGVRRREPAPSDTPPEGMLPDGVAAVLSVLKSSAVVLARDDSVVTASPAAYAYGIVGGEDLTHPELRHLARQVRRDGVIREAELELARGPLGRARLVVGARVAPLGSEFLLLLVDDRTEVRRVEEVRRDFVANVSHELKTPIGGMSLLAEALLDASDEPEAVRRFAGRMQVEARRLSLLVQEIVDLSRLQVADTLHQPEAVRVDGVVGEAVDRCRLVAAAKDIDLIVSGEPDAVVYGDAELLTRAARNLVDNAISYSPTGTRVVIAVTMHHGLVELAVSDQGVGIPDDEQSRIFERFYRVDPARSRATGGTGLGLAIVKHVCANHGGEVTVWSKPGQGATFTMRLPAAEGAVVPGDDLADDHWADDGESVDADLVADALREPSRARHPLPQQSSPTPEEARG